MRDRVRILHIADVHLDRPFGTIADADRARRRTDELFASFQRALKLGRERGAELALIAGDLFDAPSVRPATLARVAEALAAFGRPVFLVAGNHDPLLPKSPYLGLRWPENVHLFGLDWVTLDLEDRGLPGVSVSGLSFANPQSSFEPLAGFRVPDPDRLNLILLHGAVTTGRRGTSSGAYHPIEPEQIAATGASFVALGHYHTAQQVGSGGVSARYPGALESLDFGQDGEFGALVGDVGPGLDALELVPLAGRRHLRLTADVTGLVGLDQVADRLRQLAPAADRACHLFQIELTGTADSRLELDLRQLGAALADDFFALRLRDETEPDVDLDRLAEDPGARGRFVRAMRALPERNGEPGLWRAALEIGLRALEGGRR